MAINPADLLTVRDFALRYPNLGSEASLRWQIFCADLNGLAATGAIVRRGRRVFLNVPRYMAAVTGHAGSTESPT
jgi:hypothetical protein